MSIADIKKIIKGKPRFYAMQKGSLPTISKRCAECNGHYKFTNGKGSTIECHFCVNGVNSLQLYEPVEILASSSLIMLTGTSGGKEVSEYIANCYSDPIEAFDGFMESSRAARFLTPRQFAAKHHEGQLYGDLPYMVHIDAVVEVCDRFKLLDNDVRAACLLHDTLEDTDADPVELESRFGSQVYELVEAVTNEPRKNRRERAIATYPKIKANGRAVAVKLCDRVANVEAGGKMEMYRKEHQFFKESLYNGLYNKLWEHLDGLLKEDEGI